MKHIKLFKTLEEYVTYATTHVDVYPHMSVVPKPRAIYYTQKPLPSPVKAVFYDISKKKFRKLYISELYYNPNYVPVGIEIIPPSHDVYGNGKGGVISLKDMDTSNPTNGTSSNLSLVFGPQYDSTLTNYNKVITINSSGTLGSGNFGYVNKNGSYAGTPWIPSPFNEDYTRNPNYYNKTVTAFNACADFNGKNNTEVWVDTRGEEDYTSWTPTTATTDYPAASCCDMFYTEGTKQGDWYLPSAGELCYLTAYWDTVVGITNKLKELYGNDIAAPFVNGQCIWSSTEFSGANARYLHTDYGLGHSVKSTKYETRAFIQI